MMQHEMGGAMHKEHVLGVIIDMGLRHDVEGEDARHKTDFAPGVAGCCLGCAAKNEPDRLAREPGQGQKPVGQKFGPGKFPGQESGQDHAG